MYKKLIVLAALFMLFVGIMYGCSDDTVCPTSPPSSNNVTALPANALHVATAGQEYFYKQENGGIEQITHIPYDNMSCKDCHVEQTGCSSCHTADSVGNLQKPEDNACFACHGREAMMKQIYPDVHMTTNGMKCADCHSQETVHGDGTAYYSLSQNGAVKEKCEDCHAVANLSPTAHTSTHLQKVECTACHTQASVTCYNCHLETEIANGQKIPYKAGNNWKFLVKKDGKLHTASIMPVEYDNKMFIAIGPNVSHTIYKPSCSNIMSECHGNSMWSTYTSTGKMPLVTWDSTGDSLVFYQGTIPIPTDYKTAFQFDFVTKDSVGDPGWHHLIPDTLIYQMLLCEPLSSSDLP